MDTGVCGAAAAMSAFLLPSVLVSARVAVDAGTAVAVVAVEVRATAVAAVEVRVAAAMAALEVLGARMAAGGEAACTTLEAVAARDNVWTAGPSAGAADVVLYRTVLGEMPTSLWTLTNSFSGDAIACDRNFGKDGACENGKLAVRKFAAVISATLIASSQVHDIVLEASQAPQSTIIADTSSLPNC